MSTHPETTRPTAQEIEGWYSAAACSVEEFAALVETRTDPADYPWADDVIQNVLIYGRRIQSALVNEESRRAIQTELAQALLTGPGIVVFRQAFDPSVVDRGTKAFEALIAAQKAAGVQSGDHFAKPGANDRVWGALDKLAVSDPAVFADYYDNDVLALISTAWLGPEYQVTSQINVVNPGGQAQVAHRDYHLGFMSAEQSARFPAHVHQLTAALTLQGAVAHCDMPVETGPTLYLPHSQKYGPGYLAFHQPDFTSYFESHYVQLPLVKGDAAFFNPALFHGAGTNRTADVRRMANLLQISSAFGRAMEAVDRTAVSRALFQVLAARLAAGASEASINNVIAASAEGYAFPTNLDRDPPVDGLAPQTQAELVWQALSEGWSLAAFGKALGEHAHRRKSEV
ncbi:MAG: Phytanoyl-CoA dioxygenase [Propionibacteriaceae bacterium]|jgi:ectoine hydroxylase-related dioxygenase (phytanoyl-CoA dioxygenase family)|nr:Phytanoyl-CoA dioxygenase [Propionibacteriaceae bacterium]